MTDVNVAQETTIKPTDNKDELPSETAPPVAASGDDRRDIANPASDRIPCGCCGYRYWHGWCSFPQAKRGEWAILFGVSLMALILCDAATDVCGFLVASVLFEDENLVERRHVGINQYEDRDGECTSWRKGDDYEQIYENDDYLWQTVRSFVGVASVVALIVVIMLLCTTCLSFPKRVWKFMACALQLVWLLYSLSFMLFGSKLCRGFEPTLNGQEYKDCKFDVGAGLTLAGVVMWIPASFGVSYIASSLPKEDEGANSAGTIQDQEQPNTEDPDTPMASQERIYLRENKPLTGWAISWGILVVCSIVLNLAVIFSLQEK